jgi:signal transduction histidine kinase
MLRYLSPSDRTLLVRLFAVAILSLLAVFALGRFAESIFLQTESEVASRRMADFLRHNLADLDRVLVVGRLTDEDRTLFRHAAQMGGVFRYKLFNPEGRIVHASRPDDVGRQVTTPYFDSIVRQGKSYFDVAYRSIGTTAYTDELGTPYEEGIILVGERYVPIMQNGVFKGAIEVYLDMTPLFGRLRQITLAALGGVFVVFVVVGVVCSVFVYRNMVERRHRIEELQAARQKAEHLAHEAEAMLKGLVTAEHDKMSRVVNLMGGIAHEVGNPLTTLSTEIDSLESIPCAAQSADAQRVLGKMRDALRRLESFLRDITAFSYQDDDRVADFDINETIRALAGLVQLDDRARRATFSLLLSPDVPSLSMPRQPLSLALFIIFSTAAEGLNGTSGDIEVQTRLSHPGKNVEVRVATFLRDPPINVSGEMPVLDLTRSGHAALQSARQLVASLGGNMRLQTQPANGMTCVLSLPRRAAAPAKA